MQQGEVSDDNLPLFNITMHCCSLRNTGQF